LGNIISLIALHSDSRRTDKSGCCLHYDSSGRTRWVWNFILLCNLVQAKSVDIRDSIHLYTWQITRVDYTGKSETLSCIN